MSRLALAALVALAGCGGGAAASGPKPPLPGEEAKPAPAVPVGELRGELVSVDVVGLPADRTANARSALHSAVGAPFDRAQISADLRALWALGSVADARASARPVRGGIALRYTVREQPRIRSIDVQGSRLVERTQWLAQMPIKPGDFFDPVKLATVRRSMIEKLHELGFFKGQVALQASEPKETGKAGGKDAGMDVVFTIDEGRLVALMKVEFRGNKKVPRKTLVELLGEKEGAAIGARYWRGALERGLMRVSAHYHDLGYAGVSVGQVEENLSADGGNMSIVVPIREGEQYRLGALAIEGALVAPASDYATRFGLREGEIFSRRKVADGIDRIRELHKEKGQPNVDVVPRTEVDPKKRRIKLTLEVVLPQKPEKGSSPSAQPPGK